MAFAANQKELIALNNRQQASLQAQRQTFHDQQLNKIAMPEGLMHPRLLPLVLYGKWSCTEPRTWWWWGWWWERGRLLQTRLPVLTKRPCKEPITCGPLVCSSETLYRPSLLYDCNAKATADTGKAFYSRASLPRLTRLSGLFAKPQQRRKQVTFTPLYEAARPRFRDFRPTR